MSCPRSHKISRTTKNRTKAPSLLRSQMHSILHQLICTVCASVARHVHRRKYNNNQLQVQHYLKPQNIIKRHRVRRLDLECHLREERKEHPTGYFDFQETQSMTDFGKKQLEIQVCKPDLQEISNLLCFFTSYQKNINKGLQITGKSQCPSIILFLQRINQMRYRKENTKQGNFGVFFTRY